MTDIGYKNYDVGIEKINNGLKQKSCQLKLVAYCSWRQ